MVMSPCHHNISTFTHLRNQPPMNAKERRRARRAAERAEKERAGAVAEGAKVESETQGPGGKTAEDSTESKSEVPPTKMNAKERRKARREAERAEKDRAGAVVERARAETRKSRGKGNGKRFNSFRAFVGQISYKCTADDLRDHFRRNGAGEVVVRMRTRKSDGKFLGTAFVGEFYRDPKVFRRRGAFEPKKEESHDPRGPTVAEKMSKLESEK